MLRYAAFMHSQGHDVHVLHCPLQERTFEATSPPPGITVHAGLTRPGPLPFSRRAREIAKAVSLVRRLRPDIVHLLCSRAGAQAIARFSGAPLVFTPWGADILQDAHSSPLHHARTRLLLSSVRGIVAASHAMVERARELTGPAHLVRARWGFDPETFHSEGRELARVELGIPEHSFCVLSPRQWGTKYNVGVILEALHVLRRRRPDVRGLFKYCIVQQDLDATYARRIRELALDDLVQIQGPSRDPDSSQKELARCFRAADVFVSIPSWDGGSPSTLFEGMACGCVPVVSDIDTHTEYVEHGRTGYVLPRIEPNTLANLLERVASHRSETRAIAQGLPEYAHGLADTDQELGRVLALYHRPARSPEELFARSQGEPRRSTTPSSDSKPQLRSRHPQNP